MYGNHKNEKRQSGYTLIELIVVMGILTVLFGFTTINLGGVTRLTSVNETVDMLIADIRNQQAKAMTGSGDGTSGSSYGIYFQTDRYTLFRGTTYSSQNTTNFTVELDQNLNFVNDTFPNSTLIFLQTSGEISGYAAGNATIAIGNTAGNEQKTIRVNQLGTVDQIN